MRPGPCVVASVVGISCAAPGRTPLAGLVAPKKSRPALSGPALVARAALGSVGVSKWRLDNGLEVVLAPDPTATSICYMTWFKVGSRHEDAAAGETGLAHLFEHLMFTQTRSAKQAGEFDRRMEEVGASTNAMTYYDFTAYVDELPPPALPLAVALEADRMVNLALRAEQVATEREVVTEERLSSVEDSVDGLLEELMYMQAFERHPYRFPVIGLMKDIKAVTPAKALRFYATYYAPNNAVVVAAGRFEEAAMLQQISAHYGPLRPSATLPTDRGVREQAPARVVRKEIIRPVPADRLAVGYRAPALADADRGAYEVLAAILAGGPASRLHKRLVVTDEVASSVSGSVPATKDPGLYALWVQMKKGHGATKAEAVVEAEITRMATEPVPGEELDRAKSQLETAFWHGLDSSEGRAEQLGAYEVVAGDFRRLLARAHEYRAVTAADVRRVADGYLRAAGRSIVVARPKPE